MEDPAGAWFPFYGGDFGRDTAHLDAEEVGAYLLLLIHQWSKGSIPDELKRLVRITKSSESVAVDVVAEFFPAGINARLERERARSIEKRQKLSDASRVRWDRERERNADGYANEDPNGDARDISPPPPPSPSLPPEPQPDIPTTSSLVSDSMWQAFKKIYPQRSGNHYWAKARIKADKLVAAGVEWAEIMAGARRYRLQAEAIGNVGTEMIKQPQYWLTPAEQLWTEDYPISTVDGKTQSNIAVAKRWAEDNGT